MILSVMVMAVVVPLVLPLVLAGLHLALWRFTRQPPPLWQRRSPVSTRTRIVTGCLGLATCYLLCAVIAFVALRTSPSEPTLAIDPVPGMPAANAGVRPGDIARSIDGRKVDTFQQFTDGVRRGRETVEVGLERDGRPIRVIVAKDPAGRVGIRSRLTVTPGLEAVGRAIVMPAQHIALLAGEAVEMIVGRPARELEGPVGVAAAVARADQQVLSVLAIRLSQQLPKVALAYLVVLIVDALARRRYARMPGKVPPLPILPT